jgi:hypothetical protein
MDADRTLSAGYTESQIVMARGGALLVVLALLTGVYAASAMSSQLPVDADTALAAHVTALLGAFWIFGAAWTFPLLRYSQVGQLRIAWALLLSNYGGWLITAIKAAFHVHGINSDGPVANQVVFGALNIVVVIPALIASVAIVVGFRKRGT